MDENADILVSLLIDRDRRWLLITFSLLSLILGSSMLLFGLPQVGILPLAVGVAGSIMLSVAWFRTKSLAADRIEKHIHEAGLQAFDIARVPGIRDLPLGIPKHAARDVYAVHQRCALEEALAGQDVSVAVAELAASLDISARQERAVEARERTRAYRRLVTDALHAGDVNEETRAKLKKARACFGMSDDEAYRLSRTAVKRAYRRQIRDLAKQGASWPDASVALGIFREATGLLPGTATRIAGRDGEQLFSQIAAALRREPTGAGSGRELLREAAQSLGVGARRIRHAQEIHSGALLVQVDSMEGHDFEHYIARVMQDIGYATTVTRGSGDLGVDIVAERDGEKYAVQVKRSDTPISRRAVSDAVAGMPPYCCTRAMVITNNYFTNDAKRLAESNNCELVDRTTLKEWLIASP